MDETRDQGPVSGRTTPEPRKRIRRFFWATDRRRLQTYLEAYEIELAEMIRMAGPDSPENDARSSALRLVKRAESEIDEGSTNTGWSCYNAAKRIEVLGYDQEQLERLRRVVLAEAQEKVQSSWRREAIIGLVDPEHANDEQPAPATGRNLPLERLALRAAMEVRDEATQNYYWKFHHLRRQLRILGVVLVVTLALLLTVVGSQPAFLFGAATTDNATLWFTSYLVGTLGGCLSAFRSYTASSLEARIPQVYTNAVLTVLRPLIGGAAGVLAFIFLVSGLISVTVERNAGILAVAFVAGFTERLVLHVVETVGGGKTG